jgi:leucyl aminopeptidase
MLRVPFSTFSKNGTLPTTGVLFLTDEEAAANRFCQSLPKPQMNELLSSRLTVAFCKQGDTRLAPSLAAVDTLILVGLGAESKCSRSNLRKAVHQGVMRAIQLKSDSVVLSFASVPVFDQNDPLDAYRIATTVSVLSDWAFDDHITLSKKKRQHLSLVVVDDTSTSNATQAITEASVIAECTCYTRDLANTRGDVATPLFMEEQAAELCAGIPELSLSVVQFEEMKVKGMGLIAAVGQAAVVPPRIVCMEYKGDPSSTKSLALVGKGVTFDTGGLNLKGTGNIELMYLDKHGACSVLGIMKGLSALKVKANVVGVLACAENAIGAKATKPHEILTSYKGLTVQNNNTDAEGRLCLADSMTHVQQAFAGVDTMFDFATLTGACVVALGSYAAGFYCTDDGIAADMAAMGAITDERVWRMPLYPEYNDEIRSNKQCDLNSTGSGPAGGSCTAAAFLSNFVEEGVEWAHFDIAGAAMSKTARGHVNSGGNGWGVELIVRYIQQHRAAGPAPKARL